MQLLFFFHQDCIKLGKRWMKYKTFHFKQMLYCSYLLIWCSSSNIQSNSSHKTSNSDSIIHNNCTFQPSYLPREGYGSALRFCSKSASRVFSSLMQIRLLFSVNLQSQVCYCRWQTGLLWSCRHPRQDLMGDKKILRVLVDYFSLQITFTHSHKDLYLLRQANAFGNHSTIK